MRHALILGALAAGLTLAGCRDNRPLDEADRPAVQQIDDPEFKSNHELGATPDIAEPEAPKTGTSGAADAEMRQE